MAAGAEQAAGAAARRRSATVSGSTGPTSGRGAPGFAGDACGAGSATGATWFDMTRRSS